MAEPVIQIDDDSDEEIFLDLTDTAEEVTSLLLTHEQVNAKVLELFPQVDRDYLWNIIAENIDGDDPVFRVCNVLLTNNFPKVAKKPNETTPLLVEKAGEGEESGHSGRGGEGEEEEGSSWMSDLSLEYSSEVSWRLINQVIAILMNDYRMVSANDIRAAAKLHNNHYAATRRYIDDCLRVKMVSLSSSRKERASSCNTETKIASTGKDMRMLEFISQPRPVKFVGSLDPKIEQEMNFVLMHPEIFLSKGRDKEIAQELKCKRKFSVKCDVTPTVKLMECLCCYVEVMIEAMVQCEEGHLFCLNCLESYAKEATYGSGKANLQCMHTGCEAGFLRSQLQRSLPKDLLCKYDERMQDESIKMAGLSEMVKCRACGFAALLPEQERVFKCPSCKREACRHCSCEWSEHFGLSCSEVEDQSTTNFRTSVEEKMSQIKIRKCHRCGCEFLKEDGCNRMTCRCGAQLCYICRKPDVSYHHFCQHPREPAKKCNACTSCSLWTNPQEDDELAVREVQEQANRELARQHEAKLQQLQQQQVAGNDSNSCHAIARVHSHTSTVGPPPEIGPPNPKRKKS